MQQIGDQMRNPRNQVLTVDNDEKEPPARQVITEDRFRGSLRLPTDTKRAAMAPATWSGEVSGAGSTNHTRSVKPSSRLCATSVAGRVLPDPAGPRSVTNRAAASSSVASSALLLDQ